MNTTVPRWYQGASRQQRDENGVEAVKEKRKKEEEMRDVSTGRGNIYAGFEDIYAPAIDIYIIG